MRRALSIVAACLALTLWVPEASARNDEQGRPFAKGTVLPRLGVGFGFNDDLVTIGWSGGAGYFVIDGLEIGGTISGSHLIWSRDMKATYPGIQDRLPGTLVEVTPQLRYVFYRSRYFSPYAFAGVGPTFLTNNAPAPVIGHWTAGPGFMIGLGPHVFLTLSVAFSSRFPHRDCRDAFTDVFDTPDGPVQLEVGGYCGLRWSPGIGFGASF